MNELSAEDIITVVGIIGFAASEIMAVTKWKFNSIFLEALILLLKKLKR
jgi:hypothetical protein